MILQSPLVRADGFRIEIFREPMAFETDICEKRCTLGMEVYESQRPF